VNLVDLIVRGTARAWSVGAAEYFIHHPIGAFTLPVAVRCHLGRVGEEAVALLDTGAEWSVLGGSTAELVQDDLEDLDQPLDLSSRFGRFTGSLYRLDVIFAADPGLGHELRINATVLVVASWPGPIVLGYRGLLERARLALDPSAEGRPLIFFGPSE
jgi:hypothetical protein